MLAYRTGGKFPAVFYIENDFVWKDMRRKKIHIREVNFLK